MAPKSIPDKPSASLVSVLAACAAVFAVAVIGVPMIRDWYSMQNPSQARLTFNLNPAACKATFKGSQESTAPCVIHARYGVDPISKEMILFLGLEEVRMRNWEADLVSVDGNAVEASAVKPNER